jgi:cyclopropane-fatty-acyl-phospholipid synthase
MLRETDVAVDLETDFGTNPDNENGATPARSADAKRGRFGSISESPRMSSTTSTTSTTSTGSLNAECSSSDVALATRRPGSIVRRSFGLERLILKKVYEQIGRPAVQLALWDGFTVGDNASPIGRIIFHEPHVLRCLLFNPALYFGEAFSANQLTVEGDLVEVLTEVNRGLASMQSSDWWPKFLRHFRREHSFSRSKASVYHHYDIGNNFYQLWLDQHLVYTCAYYEHATATLEEAQQAKLDYVCRKLRLQPGETVIEAGCGWGALALHMAREYGVTVRAFNLSREQLAYARNRAQVEGLSDRVEFIEDDYRNLRRHIQGRCDVFVSVGMLEHVGPEHYRGMGQLIDEVLTERGRGLIHSIGRNVAKPLDSWTTKYIFPAAYTPSLREMMDIFEEGSFSVLDVENLRLHYARTCHEWLRRYESAVDRVRTMFDERFVRMWQLYLAASAAAFLNGDLQLFQVVFARDNHNDIPLTRADWYQPKNRVN